MSQQKALPRVSFGMIVLNGEPYIRYNLRALYPFAHEIIVVEGAVKTAVATATTDGHSYDTTLQTLYDFKAHEDPDNKVKIITKDGFWSEKDEMSQAYANIATGDYLWQIDDDEFYKDEDMRTLLNMLADNPDITAMSFEMMTFWGAPFCLVDSWWLQRRQKVTHRVFKWGSGYQYATHRPPTVLTDTGKNTRRLHYVSGRKLARKGIYAYHYSYLLPKQVEDKSRYYAEAEWNTPERREGQMRWYYETYLKLKNPFSAHLIHVSPSWFMTFKGTHPKAFLQMWQDIESGQLDVETRHVDDIKALLASSDYGRKRTVLRLMEYLTRYPYKAYRLAWRVRRKILFTLGLWKE